MIVTLQTERVRTIEQVAAFVEATEPVKFQPLDRDGAYTFVGRTLTRLGYRALDKPSKALVKRYLAKTTGYSRAQLTRLIRQHRETARVVDRRDGNQGRPFARVYTPADVRLLARVDADLGQMSGLATRVVLRREHQVFGDVRFERLAGISASHIYNLRGSRTYRTQRTVVEGTKATAVAVGERRAPQPDGLPGFLRVDTVHQGDRDGAKGVYLINVVDEVTQYEFVGAVVAISERFLVPVLDGLLGLFPFVVVGFHADNASRRDAPAPSTSTTPWPRCSTSCTSGTLPSRVRGATPTTPSSRARTPTSCAGSSATTTSRSASRRSSRRSLGSTCRRTSTTTGPACSPPSARAPTAASAASTGPPTSKRPTTSCAPCPMPKNASSPASRSRNSTPRPMRTAPARRPGRQRRARPAVPDHRRRLARGRVNHRISQ